MSFIRLARCAILIFILLLLCAFSGECIIYSPDIKSNARFMYNFKDKWHIYNLVPELSNEDIYKMLDLYGKEEEFEFTVISLSSVNQLDYVEYVPYTVKSYAMSDAREYYPFGKMNNTIVIFPYEDMMVKNSVRGGACGKRAFVIYNKFDDTLEDLKVRVMHEIAHCYGLDSDGLFSTHKNEFYSWMINSGYVFSDFYYSSRDYYTIFNHPKKHRGNIVFIDYTRWLLSKIK